MFSYPVFTSLFILSFVALAFGGTANLRRVYQRDPFPQAAATSTTVGDPVYTEAPGQAPNMAVSPDGTCGGSVGFSCYGSAFGDCCR